MASDRSQKALADFVSEAQETIDGLGRDLLRLARASGGGADPDPDPDLLNAIFRAAHSLKGLAAMFAVERMARLAHALEDVLDDVRMGRRPLDPGALDLLLEAPEVFSRIVSEEAGGGPPGTTDAAARLAERLRASAPTPVESGRDPLDAVALEPGVRAVLTEYEEHRLRATVRRGLALHRVKVSLDLATFDTALAELAARLKPVGEVVSTLPSADARDPRTIGFDLLFASRETLDAVRRAAGAEALVEAVAVRRGAAEPAPPAAPHDAVSPAPEALAEEPGSLRSASRTVRVDIADLDRLMSLVGELVLVKASLRGLADRVKAEGGDAVLGAELDRTRRALDRKLGALQAGILEVRMVPLEQVFEKLERMVRKLAREVGKEVELEVSGGDVELDKLIVEDLADPLMHLVRNAIDHGIEPPEARERAGKRRAGTVRLAAAPQGSRVRIVVEDDGAGLDEDRIRAVAVERGIGSAEAIAALGRREVLNLVFVPGFSTARHVTSLSGRGVGMDVVKSNVAARSGLIELHTTPGRGTRFELTLPVTLAIVRGLVVGAAGRTYALPRDSVLEIVEVGAADVRRTPRGEEVALRGATLPVVRLASLFALAGATAPERLYVVVVGLAQERLGIAVDALEGQQDVVVKPLGPALQGVRGVAGATELGSGRTVLVLDVAAIIEEIVTGRGLGAQA